MRLPPRLLNASREDKSGELGQKIKVWMHWEEADGYGRMNEALEGTMAPGDEAGPGVMSPGRRRRGFSGCDGSTWKNTGVSFPPACALVSPSFRPTIFHFLCFTSCQRISLRSALFTSSLWVFSAYISLPTHFSLSVICWQRQKIVWFCHNQNIYCHIAFMSFPEVDTFKQNSWILFLPAF